MIAKNLHQSMAIPKYTLFIPLSRQWVWEKLYDYLVHIDLSSSQLNQTEIVVYLDADRLDFKFYAMVYEDLKMLPKYFNLNSIRLIWSERPPLDDKDRVKQRRERVIEIRKCAQTYTGNSKYFMQLEDDTIPPDFAFKRLLKLIKSEQAGFVTAIECGRWSAKHAGVWVMDDINKPTRIETLPLMSGITPIQGGGAYCFVCTTKLMKEANFRDEGECFGPDVNFVLDICRKGYKALADWSIKCDHYQKDKSDPVKVDDRIEIVRWRLIGSEYKQVWE